MEQIKSAIGTTAIGLVGYVALNLERLNEWAKFVVAVLTCIALLIRIFKGARSSNKNNKEANE